MECVMLVRALVCFADEFCWAWLRYGLLTVSLVAYKLVQAQLFLLPLIKNLVAFDPH